jgi:hypothetical protein
MLKSVDPALGNEEAEVLPKCQAESQRSDGLSKLACGATVTARSAAGCYETRIPPALAVGVSTNVRGILELSVKPQETERDEWV